MSELFKCPECPAEYTSNLAAEECGEDDREQDLHARQALRHRTKRVVAYLSLTGATTHEVTE